MGKKLELTEEQINEKAVKDSFENYYKNKEKQNPKVTANIPPSIRVDTPEDFQSKMQKETDPDLIVDSETIDLPSKGLFYENKVGQLLVEYLTSKDEDVITTPSLIESGTLIDVLLKRKIKTPNIDVNSLLGGDKSAIILFLRASSYGHLYEVEVNDPRTGIPFKEKVDLRKFKFKEITKEPDEKLEFVVEIPMRKKVVKFRLLTSGEENDIDKKAIAYKDAYSLEYTEYNSMRLKASITEINGNRDNSYISRFVDAMPALDSTTIRRAILEATPEIDMVYEFTSPDGYKFKALLVTGPDFFFPSL